MNYFGEYENSYAILDQSAWQQVEFWHISCSLNIYPFLESKRIEIITTSESAQELSYQSYQPDLLSGHFSETATISGDKVNYVLSTTNGSLTRSDLDINGYKVAVSNNIQEINNERSYQLSLWNLTVAFQRMKRNKRSKADISNIYLARILSSQGKNFFIFTNDKDQITQSKIEGFKYMRPIQFLVWMVKDKYITRQKKYITRQKAVWIFEKTKKHDPQWIDKRRPNFKEYYH